MNAQLLCLLALISAEPEAAGPIHVISPSAAFAADVRGQSPTYMQQPTAFPVGQSFPAAGGPHNAPLAPPTFSQPVQVAQVYGDPAPYGTPPPYTGGDPFLPPQPGFVTPYDQSMTTYNTFPGSNGFYGSAGPEPVRYGWSSKWDVGYLAPASTQSPFGKFSVFEFDSQLRRTWKWFQDSAFSWSPEFNYRNWGGPSGLALGPNAYRLASDFQLSTSVSSPYSFEIGFTPQVASDFEKASSEAWMWDGRGALFIRTSPQWTWAIGAQYWDRVDNLIVPYAGFVWRPDDRWEFTMVWPRPRIDYFIGNTAFGPTWFYGRGEYHVEAYEVTLQDSGLTDRMQIEDFRILMGFRNYGCCASGFIEAGWVFNREFSFSNIAPDLDISSGFIARMGLRF